MKPTRLSLFIPLVVLAACGSSSSGPVATSGFETPDENIRIDGGIDNATRAGNQRQIPSTRNGFAYTAGQLEDGSGFAAYSGLKPDTAVDARSASGVATFDGTYAVAYVNGLDENDNTIGSEISNITVQVDFDDLTLVGESDNGKLLVNGQLTGTRGLEGSVTYDGVDGTLDGLTSNDEVIGVFHGSGDDSIFAGGFVGEPREP